MVFTEEEGRNEVFQDLCQDQHLFVNDLEVGIGSEGATFVDDARMVKTQKESMRRSQKIFPHW